MAGQQPPTPPHARMLSIPERIAQTELLLQQVTMQLGDISSRLHLGSETMRNVNEGQAALNERITTLELATRPQPFWKTLLPFLPVVIALVGGVVYISKLPTRAEHDAIRAQVLETRRALEMQANSIQIEQTRMGGDVKVIREALDRAERQQTKIDEKLSQALRRR